MEQWTIWLVTVVVGWVLGFTSAYVATKGKNLATKEDIGDITRAVEEVKQENRLILNQLGFEHQLRLAALERRLQAHQEAYDLWMQVCAAVWQPNEIGPKVIECQEWWRKNCLYLTEEAREKFSSAYIGRFSSCRREAVGDHGKGSARELGHDSSGWRSNHARRGSPPDCAGCRA